MNNSFGFCRGVALLSLGFLGSCLANSAVIFDSGLLTLKATDPLQNGRVKRNGILSDWSFSKAFPGVQNPTTAYTYESFSLPQTPFAYIQVSIDDPGANLFVAAYANAFSPDSSAINLGLDVNYLGDAGLSGNLAGNPLFFQVILPNADTGHLVLAVNAASPQISTPFRILVEGFYDTEYNDTNPVVPEPTTFGLAVAGFGAAMLLRFRKLLSLYWSH